MSESLKCVIALFRTCLWPCVGRWASGQEAGQPPKEEPASLHPRPAAGGETGAPRSPRGTRLKATTERAFLVSAGPPPTGSGYRRGLFLIAARADRGFSPIQSKAVHPGS